MQGLGRRRGWNDCGLQSRSRDWSAWPQRCYGPIVAFAATSLLLLDPLAERVLAAWSSIRRSRGGGAWSMGGWRVDEGSTRLLADSDAATIQDTLARLSALDLLDAVGDLRPEVVGYLGRRLAARLRSTQKERRT